ncbi:hypothetical protein PS862_01571 [Pseudomonas fluorescens]|uniref:Uncharacterized protein n=1 Tax=Pseudomonas fluorescens TaxID=294 RepID=A0A5E7IGS1_PSEFL|nr:hypothetical protein [Pseudomonas fluorescens]VVO75841.1 hypothetical protein PS862_01571 [Pseudomonas fluorescens]
MFDEIPTHVLNDSSSHRVYPLGADPVCRSPIYNAANVCTLLTLKQSLLSSGVPHE